MKVCRKCKKRKELAEFYAHKEMGDGHLNSCIDCVRRRIASHRKKNLDTIRAYDRLRGRTEKRLARNRKRQRENAEIVRKYKKKWRDENPHKIRCHSKVGRAIKEGRLVKEPCQKCKDPGVEAHHPDYTKPLKVVWLCVKHHREVHRKF